MNKLPTPLKNQLSNQVMSEFQKNKIYFIIRFYSYDLMNWSSILSKQYHNVVLRNKLTLRHMSFNILAVSCDKRLGDKFGIIQ